MALNASGTKVRIRTATELAKCLETYITLEAADNNPECFTDKDACVLFLDTSVLYHDLEDVFDGNDWKKVYDHYVPRAAAAPAAASGAPSSSAASASAGAGGAIPSGTIDWEVKRVARAIEKCASHSLRAGK